MSTDNTTPNVAGAAGTTSKWKQFRSLPECWALLIGLSALGCLIARYVFLLLCNSSHKAAFMWKIVGTHIVGGAAFGVTKGAANSDFSLLENIAINGLLTITIIFLINTAISLSGRKIFRISVLDRHLHDVQRSVSGQKKTWAKFGIPGIFLFVMLPMTSTGPIVGSVLGRMIGLGFWTNLLTVTSGSITTILMFGFAADKIAETIGDKTLNQIVVATVAVVVALLVGVRIRGWWKQRQMAGAPQDAPPSSEATSAEAIESQCCSKEGEQPPQQQ